MKFPAIYKAAFVVGMTILTGACLPTTKAPDRNAPISGSAAQPLPVHPGAVVSDNRHHLEAIPVDTAVLWYGEQMKQLGFTLTTGEQPVEGAKVHQWFVKGRVAYQFAYFQEGSGTLLVIKGAAEN